MTNYDEEQLTRTEESVFMNTFVGDYWDLAEYGLLMNDGNSVVAFDEEGPKNIEIARSQGNSSFSGIKVLNDSVIRVYYIRYMNLDGSDGNWYIDTPFSYDTQQGLLINEIGGLISSKLTLETLNEDHIKFKGVWRFDEVYPNVNYPYYVFRKLTEDEGVEKYRDYRQTK